MGPLIAAFTSQTVCERMILLTITFIKYIYPYQTRTVYCCLFPKEVVASVPVAVAK